MILSSFDSGRGIATLTFNRLAFFNTLDSHAAEAFAVAVAGFRALSSLRCVVLTGTGKASMAGGDSGRSPRTCRRPRGRSPGPLNQLHPAILQLRSLEVPVVATVNGSAAGADLSLVLGADYVVANASSKSALAYDKLGASPECGGTWFLARRVDRSRAFELMLNGGTLTADEARVAGIVNEVVPDADLEVPVAVTAARIAAGPTLA